MILPSIGALFPDTIPVLAFMLACAVFVFLFHWLGFVRPWKSTNWLPVAEGAAQQAPQTDGDTAERFEVYGFASQRAWRAKVWDAKCALEITPEYIYFFTLRSGASRGGKFSFRLAKGDVKCVLIEKGLYRGIRLAHQLDGFPPHIGFMASRREQALVAEALIRNGYSLWRAT